MQDMIYMTIADVEVTNSEWNKRKRCSKMKLLIRKSICFLKLFGFQRLHYKLSKVIINIFRKCSFNNLYTVIYVWHSIKRFFDSYCLIPNKLFGLSLCYWCSIWKLFLYILIKIYFIYITLFNLVPKIGLCN